MSEGGICVKFVMNIHTHTHTSHTFHTHLSHTHNTQSRTLKMHLYTVIQVFLIAGLFALKLSPGAMVYPVTIVFLVPVRKFLGRFIFTHTEIEAVGDVCKDKKQFSCSGSS